MVDWQEKLKSEIVSKREPPLEKHQANKFASSDSSGTLNLLNVGTSKNKAAPAPKEATRAPEKKEEQGSLFSLAGVAGTIKGAGWALASMPLDICRSIVNPDVSRATEMVTKGQSGRLADQFGLAATARMTLSNLGTGLSYLAENHRQVVSGAYGSYYNASSEKKGVMVGQTVAVVGTMLWGTGLGSKAAKLARFGRIEEGLAEVSAFSRVGRGLKLGKGLTSLTSDINAANLAEKAASGRLVLPARAGRPGAATKFLTRATNGSVSALSPEIVAGAEQLTSDLKVARDLLGKQGGRAATNWQATESDIKQLARAAAEHGPESQAGQVALRELRAKYAGLKQTLTQHPDTATLLDHSLSSFETRLATDQHARLALSGKVSPQALTRQLESKQEAFSLQLGKAQKELATSSKPSDVLALQRSREIETSLRNLSHTDAPARQEAFTQFTKAYDSYSRAAKESSLSSKLELAATDNLAADLRTAARTTLDLPAGATGRTTLAANLNRSEPLAVTQEKVGLQVREARNLTEGATSIEATALRNEAEKLERSIGNLQRVEQEFALTARQDAALANTALAEKAVIARDQAAADFESQVQAWNKLVSKEGSIARTAGVDLTVIDEALLGYRNSAGTTSGVATDAAAVTARASIRAYNEALSSSSASELSAGLKVDESTISKITSPGSDRLANINPVSYAGDGSRKYLAAALTDTQPGSFLAHKPASTRVDFDGLPMAGLLEGTAKNQVLTNALSGAVDSIFRGGGLVLGLIPDSALSYLESAYRTAAPWLKGYVVANDAELLGKLTLNRIFDATQLARAQSIDIQGGPVQSQQQISSSGASSADGSRAVMSGTTPGGDTTGGSQPYNQTVSISDAQRASTQAGPAGAAVAGLAGIPGITESAESYKRNSQPAAQDSSSTQAIASPQGPALSPIVQALTMPRPDAQVFARETAVLDQKKKPSWWTTVYGDNSGHRPLLKADISQPTEETKEAPVIAPPRRFGSVDGNSQRVVTPTFSPTFIRRQSELLGTVEPRQQAVKQIAATGSSERRDRTGTSGSKEKDKLIRLFPFLISSTTSGESGIHTTGTNIASRAEDQEHKNAGKVSGSSGTTQAAGITPPSVAMAQHQASTSPVQERQSSD